MFLLEFYKLGAVTPYRTQRVDMYHTARCTAQESISRAKALYGEKSPENIWVRMLGDSCWEDFE